MLKKIKDAEKMIAADREEVVDGMVRLGQTDLMMFWGQERELIRRQEEVWTPIIKWLEGVFSAPIKHTTGLDVPSQDGSLTGSFRVYLESLSNHKLALFCVSAMLLKSFLLATAFTNRKISVDEAFEAAFVDELWQNQTWGTVAEAAEKQHSIKEELTLLRQEIDKDA